MQVTFKYKTGQTRKMTRQEANILQHLGHGDIVKSVDAPAPAPAPAELTLEQLKAIAVERGIKHHPNIGHKKLLALVEGSKA